MNHAEKWYPFYVFCLYETGRITKQARYRHSFGIYITVRSSGFPYVAILVTGMKIPTVFVFSVTKLI